MSISSTPKTDAEALYANNKHKSKNWNKGSSSNSNRPNKSEAQSKRGMSPKKVKQVEMETGIENLKSMENVFHTIAIHVVGGAIWPRIVEHLNQNKETQQL